MEKTSKNFPVQSKQAVGAISKAVLQKNHSCYVTMSTVCFDSLNTKKWTFNRNSDPILKKKRPSKKVIRWSKKKTQKCIKIQTLENFTNK